MKIIKYCICYNRSNNNVVLYFQFFCEKKTINIFGNLLLERSRHLIFNCFNINDGGVDDGVDDRSMRYCHFDWSRKMFTIHTNTFNDTHCK